MGTHFRLGQDLLARHQSRHLHRPGRPREIFEDDRLRHDGPRARLLHADGKPLHPPPQATEKRIESIVTNTVESGYIIQLYRISSSRLYWPFSAGTEFLHDKTFWIYHPALRLCRPL